MIISLYVKNVTFPAREIHFDVFSNFPYQFITPKTEADLKRNFQHSFFFVGKPDEKFERADQNADGSYPAEEAVARCTRESRSRTNH